MQGDVAPMQILSKLDAEMRCRLIYHLGFRLSYITHTGSPAEEHFVHDLDLVLEKNPVRKQFKTISSIIFPSCSQSKFPLSPPYMQRADRGIG